ncbi:hypothetical protein [Paenibacillus protaetiae]|uniref:Uncharacterized protein n=1 Tax=Paenibacillus protaetiae TaxID=2509456 RepID=A0A4P6EV31_9BACL|nr:hypothetical protein [Paenibacillus protaetiae]QAY66862.1 hypothetical protein ET464_11110 [Paenibacillus protaetiae]
MFAIRRQDFGNLGAYIDPKKNVLLYPHIQIDKKKAVTFQAGKLPDLTDAKTYTWGSSPDGKTVKATFGDYYSHYIYDQDYAAAGQIGRNELIQPDQGKSNIATVFPGASYFDYYIKDAKTGAWSSLILVLEQTGDTWYLTGILHDEGK